MLKDHKDNVAILMCSVHLYSAIPQTSVLAMKIKLFQTI